jgi:hypothetical protein
MSAWVAEPDAERRWFIDALDPAAGRAFISKRAADTTLAEAGAPPLFVAAPYFVAEPLADPATALAAARSGYQVGVFATPERPLPFLTIEEAVEFVRRIYARVGGTGRDGGGGGEGGAVPTPTEGGGPADGAAVPEMPKLKEVLLEIAEFSRIAEKDDDKRKVPRPELPWRHTIESIQATDRDKLLDWALNYYWQYLEWMKARMAYEPWLELTERYNDAVFLVGGQFGGHLKWTRKLAPWPFVFSEYARVDRFDLLSLLPAPPKSVAGGPTPTSLAELLALATASPEFIGNSLERLAIALMAAAIVAYQVAGPIDGAVGGYRQPDLSAGRAGAVWLADNWPRVVQSKEAEALIRAF